MKIIALSDSHGCRADLVDAITLAREGGPIDACVFLGDGLRDFAAAQPILRAQSPDVRVYAVCGNNDFGRHEPYLEVFSLGGCRFFATHGHAYNVKYGLERLCFAAREQQAQVAFFGHTHCPLVEPAYGVYFVNPGAVCDRRPGHPAFARVLVGEQGALKVELVRWR